MRPSSLVVLVLVAASAIGCGRGGSTEPPELGTTALVLRVCLASEPEHDGPCTDEALENCPTDMSRSQCLATALSELTAYDRYSADPPATDTGLPIAGGLATVGGTLALFALIEWRVVRQTRARNDDAFRTELPSLTSAGFVESDAAHLPPSIVTEVRAVRHVLVRDGDAALWLVESEPRGTSVGSLWPARTAIITTDREVPTGRLTPRHERGESTGPSYASTFGTGPNDDAFVAMLRTHLDPCFPQVAVDAHGDHVMLRSVQAVKVPGRKQPTPIGLAGLAVLAEAISVDLQHEDDGVATTP
jgi:hypothetical protein